LLLQIGDRAFADHAPVGDDAHLADAEAPPQAIDNRDQGGHVGGIARPQFAADRPAVAVEHGADHHLPLVRPMILTVAILPQTLAAVAFEIQRRGIEEDHFHLGEQIAAAAEEMFLDDVLVAQLLVKGAHRALQGIGHAEILRGHQFPGGFKRHLQNPAAHRRGQARIRFAPLFDLVVQSVDSPFPISYSRPDSSVSS